MKKKNSSMYGTKTKRKNNFYFCETKETKKSQFSLQILFKSRIFNFFSFNL